MNTPEITLDTLFNGALRCKQHREGYRFSLDSVLVAHFLRMRRGDSVLDLGCGCGIIGIILLFRGKDILSHVTGIEVQALLLRLALENRELNGFEDTFSLVEGDIREIRRHFEPESFSQVISNPPFYKPSEGRGSVHREVCIARHQVLADLRTVVEAAGYCLKSRGRLVMVFPSEGGAELVHILRHNGLEPKRMQYVYSRPDDETAQLVLIEAVKNGGVGVKILRPFYVYRNRGERYSDPMQSLYEFQAPSRLS